MNINNLIQKAKEKYLSISKEKKEEKAIAREEWNELSIMQIDGVSSLQEAINAFKVAPWGMPAKEYALERWAELCTTIKELKVAYGSSFKRFRYFEKNPALQKWEAISCIEVHTATNAVEIEKAYLDCPVWCAIGSQRGQCAVDRAFVKWLYFCETLREMSYLYDVVERNYRRGLDRDAWEQKYDELHLKTHGYLPTRMVLWAGH